MPDVLTWFGLILLGVVVGAYGTMIGAGGGFILVPLLLLLYPDDRPELVTSISIAVVFFNAFSGTAAYWRQRRIDFLAANAFALATVPGAIGGALATALFPRRLFDFVFALLLILVAVVLTLRPSPRMVVRQNRRGEVTRQLTDVQGDTYVYSYNLTTGIVLSLLVGFIASLLGVGGGIIHVPMMIQLLHFPAHIATATSHYVLTVTAAVATVTHILSGQFDTGYDRTGALAIGVLIGAQFGARLSTHVHGNTIVRLLGLALAAVGLRLLVAAVTG